MSKGKILLAFGLAGILVLGLQTSAHAQTAAQSRTRLAVVDTANAGHGYSRAMTQLAAATVTVTVVRGDTLSGLASRHCGNSTWTNIYQDNQSVVGGNPNLIFPGQQLVINCVAGTASAAPAPAATAAPVSSGWVAPVNACVSSGYGMRWGRMHNGVDLGAGYGTPIRAAAAGTVSVGWQAGGAGNYTMINHGNGVWTVYMHQSSFALQSGWVDAGQTIGYVGSTGDSTAPHLHFEVHTGGLWHGMMDPVPFMSARGAALGC
jgi:murein DD-endopeptidase MepM/ murein hydrolase activator NlpD